MRTVGRKFSGEKGDAVGHCSYCGARWYLSQLRRDGAGRWACPDEGPGADEVTLDRENAALARQYRPLTGASSAAPFFKTADGDYTHRTTSEDI